MNGYEKRQSGDTDSERILLYIVDLINDAMKNKGQELPAEERLELINQLVVDMSVGNKLNLLLFDGEYMYVHSNYRESLHYLKKDDSVFFLHSHLVMRSGMYCRLPSYRYIKRAN